MENEALTFDFARGASPRGYGGVSSAAKGQGPTRSDIARAKREAQGGRRKICRKGKNCSATCIAMNEDCLVELPLPLQREIKRAAIYIARKQKLTPGSAADIRQGIALQQMAPSLKVAEGERRKTEKIDGKVTQKPRLEFDRSARDQKRAKRARTLLEESLELQKRLPLLQGADKDEAKRRILQLDAFSRGVKLPRNELEAMYDLLPEKTRKSMQNSGKATGQWYNGKDKNGENQFKTGKDGSRERGLAVFDMWMRQGGTDAYLGKNGKRFAPQDMDVEHIVPLSKGGKDTPSNWVMIRSGLNNKRQNDDLESFINRLPKTEAEQREYLRGIRKADTRAKIKKKAIENVEFKNLRDEDVLAPSNIGLNPKSLSKMLNSYGKLRDWGKVGDVAQGGAPNVRLQSTAPAMFRTGINFLYKNQVPGADRIAQNIKDTWNKELIQSGSLTPQAALSKMMSSLTPHLSASQNAAVMKDLNTWLKTNSKYGFSVPRTESAPARTSKPKRTTTKATTSGKRTPPTKKSAMEAHLERYRNSAPRTPSRDSTRRRTMTPTQSSSPTKKSAMERHLERYRKNSTSTPEKKPSKKQNAMEAHLEKFRKSKGL